MLTIFPNYAICFKDNQYWIESSQLLVNQTIIKNGIELRIAAVVDYSICEGNYSVLDTKSFELITLGIYNAKYTKAQKFFNYFKYLIKIIKIIRNSKYSYIYCPGHIGLVATLTAWFLKKPYSIYLRGEWKDFTPKFFHMFFHSIIKKSKFIICTGSELAINISKINPDSIAVAPMSPLLYSAPFFITKKNDNVIKILFVGQLIKQKGVFELIYAFQKINCNTDINLELNIIGNGAEEMNLINLIKKLNLEKFVSIFSINANNDKLAYQYATSDIFCLPTYSEGFPRVIYEAMHFSLPIITTKVGQIPTLIKDGENGIFCIPGSSESLADKLNELIKSKSLRLFLGNNGNYTLKPLLNNWRKTSHGDQIVKLMKQKNMTYPL
jgi:glycosyltransferase involved in cell wall biosynthesis